MMVKTLDGTAAFIKKVSRETAQKNIRFLLLDVPFIEDGSATPCAGYFDHSQRHLVVAAHKPLSEWLSILVHEYCHFLQWQERKAVWRNCQVDSRDSSIILDQYFLGANVAEETLDRAFAATIAVELDCERRAVELIRTMNLPLDVEKYIQRANAYLYFHHEARLRRSWYNPKRGPSMVESLWSKMPKDFDTLDHFDPAVLDKLPSFSPIMPRGTRRLKSKKKTLRKTAAKKSKRK